MAKKRKSFLDGLLYVVNTIAAFGLMCSYLSNYVSPKYFTGFSFLGLAYPYLLLANIIFALWWALRVKIKIVLPLVAILLGFNQIPLLYQGHHTRQVVAAGSALKVMTYNVRSLNQFMWLEDEQIPEKISALVLKESPDLLLLQEFRTEQQGWQIDYPYQYSLLDEHHTRNGNIIYSRYPIVNSGYYELPGPEGSLKNGRAIWADIAWKNSVFRVFNLHLSSVGLGSADYEDLNQLNQDGLQEDLNRISGSLSNAFKKRAYQVEYLDSLFTDLDMPLIVGGDFNDPPYSYTYHHLNKHLEDSYIAAGEGFVTTFDRKPLKLRIDYLLYSPNYFQCHQYEVIKEKLSDHYPVISEFTLR